VLEDVAPARQGDQIDGCGVAEARLAMEALARVHAPVFGDPALARRRGSTSHRRSTRRC